MNRKDGIKCKHLDGLHNLMPYIMPSRCDSEVYISTKIDCTELEKYITKLKKKDEFKDITYFHVFCTAIGKMFYNKPKLNRFIINKKFYDRKFISIGFVAKKQFNDAAEELFSTVYVDDNDNLFTLSEKISDKVKGVRGSKTNSADGFIDKVGRLPKLIKFILIGIVKFADNHDLIPSSLTKDSIYHQSVLVSNLGSIDCGAIYHHLTNFGTTGIIITIGKIQDDIMIINGKEEIRKTCEFGVTLDEKIADGYYFAQSLNLFKYIIENPKLLEENANVKIKINN